MTVPAETPQERLFCTCSLGAQSNERNVQKLPKRLSVSLLLFVSILVLVSLEIRIKTLLRDIGVLVVPASGIAIMVACVAGV